MNEEIILEKEMFHITYFDEKELSFREHYEIYKNIKNDILHVLNKYNIKFVLAETEIIKDLQKENARLKDKIEKAVEYIKTNCKEWENDDYDVTLYYSLNQNECDELLKILKEN